MDFDQYIESLELLLEKKRRKSVLKSTAKRRSLKNRKERAKNVDVKWAKPNKVKAGRITRHKFKAKSAEKSESNEHEGEIDVFTRSGRISNVNCSCADFQSRYRYWRNKDGISSYDSEITPKNEIFDPHTQEEPEIMNKDGEGYLCKHLLKAIEELEESKKDGKKG